MKKLLVAILAGALLSVPSARAQFLTTQNEISSSYGVSVMGATLGMVIKYANFIGEIGELLEISSGDNIRVRSGGSKGIINMAYGYQYDKHWQFGIAFGFNRISVELSDNTGTVKPLVANMFTIMNTAQFNWFRTDNDKFGMYSKAGAGVLLANYGLMVGSADERTGTKPFFAPHLTAVGLEVGQDFRGFMELGMGMQGILQLGIKARF